MHLLGSRGRKGLERNYVICCWQSEVPEKGNNEKFFNPFVDFSDNAKFNCM